MWHMKTLLIKLSLGIIKSLRMLFFKVRNTVMPRESVESTSFQVLQNRSGNCPARKTDPSQMATGTNDGLR